MSVPNVRVDIQGLKELRSALRKVDAQFPKELRLANKAAADIVVPEAKRRAGQSRPNLAGGVARAGSRGAGSIRALAQQTSAQIAGGSAGVPWFAGNDRGSGGAYRQFPSASAEGYILYPAAKAKRNEVVEVYNKMLGELTHEAFPD
jgi:hypothetical protein